MAEIGVDVAPNLQVRLRDAQVAVPPPVLRELGGVGARAVGERRQVAVVAAAAAAASVGRDVLEDHGGPIESLEGQVDVFHRRTRGRRGGQKGLVRRNRGVPKDGRVLDHRVEEIFEGRQHGGGALVVAGAGGLLARGHGSVAEDGGPCEGQIIAESAAVPRFREVVTFGTADLPGGTDVVAGRCVVHDAVLGAGKDGEEEEAGAEGEQEGGGRHCEVGGENCPRAKTSIRFLAN